MMLSKGVPWLAAGAVLLSSCNENKEATVTPPPPVIVVAVEPRNVPIFDEWISRLDGSANVDVRARVQGYVQEIAFNEGTVVNEGDLLLRIDPRPYEAALAQAQARALEPHRPAVFGGAPGRADAGLEFNESVGVDIGGRVERDDEEADKQRFA